MNPYLHNIWDGRSSKLAHVTTTINHTHTRTHAPMSFSSGSSYRLGFMSTGSTLATLDDDQVVEGLVGGVPFVA